MLRKAQTPREVQAKRRRFLDGSGGANYPSSVPSMIKKSALPKRMLNYIWERLGLPVQMFHPEKAEVERLTE